jgi:hypothetical protein
VNGLVTCIRWQTTCFASVIADNDTKTITDVDGKFTIKKSINSFSVSYIGFVKKTIKVSGDKNFTMLI